MGEGATRVLTVMARDCAAETREVYQTRVFQRTPIAHIIAVRRGSHLPINSGSIRVLCGQVLRFESSLIGATAALRLWVSLC
ncbi:MAG: hypothetical protein CM15mP74_05490 [Halieaceae bacterium]|nr:MAG: hypothetical protein CM15mP74_05490 [Halieaceae bacterium]